MGSGALAMRDAFAVRISQIMIRMISIIVVACATAMGSTALAAGILLLHRTVEVDGVSAAVAVYGGIDVSREGYAVGATFQVAKGSPVFVACLTINRDFQYELTNSRGQVIPIDQKALEGMDITPRDVGVIGDCRVVPNVGQKMFKYLMLAPLYPNLAPGTYSLHVTFAPRGVSGRAELPPVQITVGNGHPPI
jgi:hypothetical protein